MKEIINEVIEELKRALEELDAEGPTFTGFFLKKQLQLVYHRYVRSCCAVQPLHTAKYIV